MLRNCLVALATIALDGTCSLGNTKCFNFGDVLRLKSSVSCVNSDAQVTLVCNQLKNYGLVVSDTGHTPQGRFGLDTGGVDDWHSAVFLWFHTLTLSDDFDIIQRGALAP